MPILQARLAKFTVSADGKFVQVPLAQITWYHHISMLPKVKDLALRAFYMTEITQQVVEQKENAIVRGTVLLLCNKPFN